MRTRFDHGSFASRDNGIGMVDSNQSTGSSMIKAFAWLSTFKVRMSDEHAGPYHTLQHSCGSEASFTSASLLHLLLAPSLFHAPGHVGPDCLFLRTSLTSTMPLFSFRLKSHSSTFISHCAFPFLLVCSMASI